MNIQKYKCGDMGNIIMEALREREEGHNRNPNIDPSRTPDNVNMRTYGTHGVTIPIKAWEDTFRYWKQKHEETTGRALRSDAVTLATVIVTLPEAYKSEPKDRQTELLCCARHFLLNKFSHGNTADKISNVTHAIIHFDETSPHLHFGFVPVVVADGKPRIAFKSAVPRKTYINLHREMDKWLQNHLDWYKGGIILSDEERVEKYAVYNQWQAMEVRDALKQHAEDLAHQRQDILDVGNFLKTVTNAIHSDASYTLIGKLYRTLLNVWGTDKCITHDSLTKDEWAVLDKACRMSGMETPTDREKRLERTRSK